MRASGFVILVAAVLVAVVTGCGGAHRYDGRLVAADSLMWDAPDSALAIVSTIDSLAGESDRAYHDLLLTQARYKAYQEITAADDSAITRAVDYYRRHSSEREKLTRAYLYKGAVMEELGHVDSAMYYYKTAEASADPNDYSNLGQINTRIAYLYRISFADEQTCFDKYQLAYQYYVKSGNKELQLNSLYSLFMINGITHQQNHEKLYDTAIALARDQHDDHMLFDLYELRCRQLSRVDSTCPQAKQIALNCYYGFDQYTNNDLLLDLAYLYTIENKLDSARFFVKNVDESLNPDDEQRIGMRKHEILSKIAEREGNPVTSGLHLAVVDNLSDSILDNKDKYGIIRIENSFNSRQHISVLSKVSHLHWMIIGLAVTAILVMALLILGYMRRLRNTNAIIKELQKNNPSQAKELLNQFDARNTAIGHLVANLVDVLKMCVSKTNMKTSSVQLASQIKDNLVDVADDGFWNELRTYLDHEHNNMISTIASNPDISKKDLKFIELSCCGFSYLEIAMILDYSPRYVLNKRKIIAQKLGIQKPLQDYLNDLMNPKSE